MKYRIQADVCFATEKDALDLLSYIESIKTLCASGTDNDKTVARYVRYHECKHDDNPPTRCGNYTTVDFGAV